MNKHQNKFTFSIYLSFFKFNSTVFQIMKEWSDLEERYQDLRAKDPHGAEEFKHRMTQRFQQTVEAVEAENEAERHQLTALHQQRIVAHINEMKREAMTCYTRALAEKQPNVRTLFFIVTKTMKHPDVYIYLMYLVPVNYLEAYIH